MSELNFGSWTVDESPITIEYSLVVIEEIRHAVAEGFQRLSRGGIEVGGILYGIRDGRTVRVLAMRPIACEHARGPAFLLSDKDRVALNQQIASDSADPKLDGMISLGWFLSHTRSEITLTDSDQELYSIFFPAPWQATLVVRPGRGGSMRAGFFVREADGTMKAERSYLEFNFPDRLAGVLDRVPPSRGTPAERRFHAMPRAEAFQSSAVAARREETSPTPFARPQYLEPPQEKKKWPWVAAIAAAVIFLAVVFGLRSSLFLHASEPISLAVVERDGQLRIEWNHTSRPIQAAVRGTLAITDGKAQETFGLSQHDLIAGSYTYARKTGNVEVRMTVEDADGGKVEEASRFLGRAPAKVDSSELEDLRKKRDELESEVQRLTEEHNAQQEKIQQLQRTVEIMQTRVGKD